MTTSRYHCGKRTAFAVWIGGMLAGGACLPIDTPAIDSRLDAVWEDPIEVASGNAHRGPWRMNASNFDFVDDPTVAIAESGRIAVAWADLPRQDIVLQLFNADGDPRFEEPVNISRSPDIFSWLPRLRFDPADTDRLYVLWQEIVFSGGSHGGEIFFARSRDGGETFEEPVNLSRTPAGAGKGRLSAQSWHNGSLDLAAGPDGNLYVAWTEYEGALRFRRSTDGGETFSEPLLIAGEEDDLPGRGPALAAGPGGTVHLAWTVGEDPGADIRLARSNDGGETFGDARTVAPGDAHADAPKLAMDGTGIVHLVYAESDEGPGGRYGLRYTMFPKDADEIPNPRALDDRPGRDVRSAHFPALHVDSQDRLFLVWELFPQPHRRPQGLGFAVSTDGGDTFSAPLIIPGSRDEGPSFNGSQQGLLMNKLAVGNDGSFAVVNSTFRAGDASSIRLFRGRVAESDDNR